MLLDGTGMSALSSFWTHARATYTPRSGEHFQCFFSFAVFPLPRRSRRPAILTPWKTYHPRVGASVLGPIKTYSPALTSSFSSFQEPTKSNMNGTRKRTQEDAARAEKRARYVSHSPRLLLAILSTSSERTDAVSSPSSADAPAPAPQNESTGASKSRTDNKDPFVSFPSSCLDRTLTDCTCRAQDNSAGDPLRTEEAEVTPTPTALQDAASPLSEMDEKCVRYHHVSFCTRFLILPPTDRMKMRTSPAAPSHVLLTTSLLWRKRVVNSGYKQ